MRFVVNIIAAIALLCPPALADIQLQKPYKFTFTVFCAGRVNCEQGLNAFRNAGNYLKKRLNITLEIDMVVRSDEDMTGGFFERLTKWRQRAEEYNSSDATIFFIEPYPSSNNFFDFDEESILGLASGLGVLGKEKCFTFVKVMGSEQFTTRITTHEIGHLLGAWHVDAGLMHPSASVNQYSDEYSMETIQQILKHLSSL